jgi:hypothetical protein
MRVLRVNESVLALALEYLGLEDLVAFDSAVTNREGRGHYLTALSRVDVTKALEGFQEKDDDGDRGGYFIPMNARWCAAFKWVATRGLRLPVVLNFPLSATDETLEQGALRVDGALRKGGCFFLQCARHECGACPPEAPDRAAAPRL